MKVRGFVREEYTSRKRKIDGRMKGKQVIMSTRIQGSVDGEVGRQTDGGMDGWMDLGR